MFIIVSFIYWGKGDTHAHTYTYIHTYTLNPYPYSHFICFLYPNLNSPETGRDCMIYFGAMLQWLTCSKFIST